MRLRTFEHVLSQFVLICSWRLKRTIELDPLLYEIISFEMAGGLRTHYIVDRLTVMTSMPVSEELLVQ